MGRFVGSRSGTESEKGKMAEDEGLEPTRPKSPVFKTGVGQQVAIGDDT